MQQHSREMGEQSKMELEEKIWKEAEESLRQEFESQIQQEKETLQHKVSRCGERDSHMQLYVVAHTYWHMKTVV